MTQSFFALQAPFDAAPIAMDLQAAERSLAGFEQLAAPMRAARDALYAALMRAARDALYAALIAPDPEMPMTADAREHNERLSHDIHVLENGAWGLGYHDRRLDQFLGEPHRGAARQPRDGAPGLKLVEHWIGYARNVIEQEKAARAVRWPARCRYTWPNGLMDWHGRKLKKGDIVPLERLHLEAWADRFERVEQEQDTS